MTSSGDRQITCSRCGREFPAAFWRAHEHNADRAHCVEPGCAEFAAGYAIRGMSPLCGTHLVQRRRRGHEVRFADGGTCTACRGYGQVAPEEGNRGDWERCLLCGGSGYLDEERLSRERSRTEEEQLAEYRHRSELRREIEEGIARRREEERRLNERRRMEIERARQYEESRLRALSGQPPESGPDDEEGEDGGDDGGWSDGGGEGGGGRRHGRGRCCTVALALAIAALIVAAAAGGAAAVFYLGFDGELPGPTPTPTQAAPTPTPTPVPTATPTATPTLTPTPTPAATATATPMPTATATAVPRPTATPMPPPTPTPVPTATPLPPPTAIPTPEATATPTPEPARSGDRGSDGSREPSTDTPGPFGPVEGYLQHDEDGFIEEFGAGVVRSDFVAAAEFHNPYPTVVSGWDYGFLFRDAGQQNFHAVVVENTSGMWFHYLRDGAGEARLVDSGQASGLWRDSEGVNDLRVVALGEQGWLFLNGKFIEMLDLSGGPAEGNVSVITGYHSGNELTGRSTRFREFSVHEPQSIGNRSGVLDHTEDGFIERSLAPGSPSDFIAVATFTNPNAGSAGWWDYGFAFRGVGPDSYRGVYVGSDRGWNHFLREGNVVSPGRSGRALNLNTREDAQNTLMLVAVGGTGVFYLNGAQVSALDLGEGATHGSVGIGSGFSEESRRLPGQQTRYNDFRVWSLDR